MELEDELRSLLIAHADDLEEGQWPLESARWAELVFCVLNAYADGDAGLAREIVTALAGIGMVEPAALNRARKRSNDEHLVLRHVLTHYGFDEAEGQRVIAVLGQLGRTFTRQFDGKLQRYLRAKAEELRDDLVDLLDAPEESADEVRGAVTHWLQNALALPLSVNDRHVREFCDERGISVGELQDTADDIDLNVAVVDDLIRVRNTARATAGAEAGA
ncbi:hypothetical protein [Amycolatopsis viridis]|uniref:Uncharacterized protein n=1 Tax=Amycolatopsis viridis TaxID=185678 RepID=A0ABX0T0G8_9PSEU|nr:hypothetical protein [Amycolatopsis viridis]NIH82119.1 hypothetical protein [Amycolatopsis viridis]